VTRPEGGVARGIRCLFLSRRRLSGTGTFASRFTARKTPRKNQMTNPDVPRAFGLVAVLRMCGPDRDSDGPPADGDEVAMLRAQTSPIIPSSRLSCRLGYLRIDAPSSRPWVASFGASAFDGRADGPELSSGRAEALANRARERLLTTCQFSSPVSGAVAARTEEFMTLG
jgi:hypothetical protein